MLISNIILSVLKKVIEILEKKNFDWYLFGGLAMQAYRRIHATRDIEFDGRSYL
jgi:hypothetical protein